MIKSFKDSDTENLYNNIRVPKWNQIERVARRKLLMLDQSQSLVDLLIPPGNRLEELKGDRKGQFSIRINNQYRICFRWDSNNAYDTEIVDYH